MTTCPNCGLAPPEGSGEACPRCGSLLHATPGSGETRTRIAPEGQGAAPTAPPSTGSPRPPIARVGAYELQAELGRGGMGAVYRAWDTNLRRVVAVKLLLVETTSAGTFTDPESTHRFLREARLAARLDHPGIVRIHEVGSDGGRHFLVMDLVDGGGLDRWIEKGLELRRGIEVLRDVARALAHAHARGVLHRDLKPHNVLVAQDGSVRLTDFGLARDLGQESTSFQTLTGTVLGTPLYMSPEQVEGQASRLGPATDIWSMGVMLYRIATGRMPFEGASLAETFERIRRVDPIPPRRIQRDTPVDVERVCLKCLEKAPSLRYASAEDLAADLEAILEERAVAARSPSTMRLAARWVGRRRVGVLAALVVIASALGAWGAWTYRQGQKVADAQAAREKEVREAQSKALSLCERAEFLLRSEPRSNEALKLLLEARRLDASLARPLAFLAFLHRARGELDLAEQAVLEALARDPDSLPALMEHFFILRESKLVPDMEPLLKVRELSPESDVGRYAGGMLLLIEGKREEALRELQAAAELGPGFAEIPYAEAEVWSQLGEHQKMVAALRRAIEIDSGFARAWNNLGVGLFYLGEFEEAETAQTRSIELNPRNPSPYNSRAVCREKRGDGTGALSDYTEAIEKAKADPQRLFPFHGILLNRAHLLQALGKIDDARQDMDEAVAASGQAPDFVYARALFRIETGDKPGAEEDLSKHIDAGGAQGDALWRRGILRSERGDWAAARDDFRAFLDRYPDLPGRETAEAWLCRCEEELAKRR